MIKKRSKRWLNVYRFTPQLPTSAPPLPGIELGSKVLFKAQGIRIAEGDSAGLHCLSSPIQQAFQDRFSLKLRHGAKTLRG